MVDELGSPGAAHLGLRVGVSSSLQQGAASAVWPQQPGSLRSCLSLGAKQV